MATFKGLVNTLQIRDDGWVEVMVKAVHAGNATMMLFIKDLDGDISIAHKRLGQLSLLRDAVARVLPVEIDYQADAAEGNLITEVSIHPRASIDGRKANTFIEGIVIGLSIAEIGPVSGLTPYLDSPDLAGVTLLKEEGSIVNLLLDLQREEKMTMHAMLELLQTAHRNRRPVRVQVSVDSDVNSLDTGNLSGKSFGTLSSSSRKGLIEACEWVTIQDQTLEYCHAFIERMSLRYESYDPATTVGLTHIKVVYSTVPAQIPEGDVSQNGSFVPATSIAWVHHDSPLFKFLKMALKKGLQVRLGLLEDQIHEVEVASHLGSSVHPIWICVNQSVEPSDCDNGSGCSNVPTVQNPTGTSLGSIPACVVWRGRGYFNEGVWCFKVTSSSPFQIRVDCNKPCCAPQCDKCCHCSTAENQASTEVSHFYLKGMHTVKLILNGYQSAQPFELQIYRIR